ALRYEHESGPDGRLSAASRGLDLRLDQFSRPAGRNVFRRPILPSLSRHTPCVLRQIPPPQRQAVHLPLQLRSHQSMSNDRHYDVIIIGTGAGGGTLARKLAPTGKRVLLLERGDYIPREKDNWSTRAVNVQGKYQTKE